MERDFKSRTEGFRRMTRAMLKIKADVPGLTDEDMAAIFARFVACAILAAAPEDREQARDVLISWIDSDVETVRPVFHVQ